METSSHPPGCPKFHGVDHEEEQAALRATWEVEAARARELSAQQLELLRSAVERDDWGMGTKCISKEVKFPKRTIRFHSVPNLQKLPS